MTVESDLSHGEASAMSHRIRLFEESGLFGDGNKIVGINEKV
jgi:hypothetical protein